MNGWQYLGASRVSTPVWLLARRYVDAKLSVINAGYAAELAWQTNQRWNEISEEVLLRETAWVILSAGMREQVVRGRFPFISRAFLSFHSAAEITTNSKLCVERAFKHYRHLGKVTAITDFARLVAWCGYRTILQALHSDPFASLLGEPYFGRVTIKHLMKNLGIAVAKPDRHLSRISEEAGYDDTQRFCEEISNYTGDPVPLVDLVLWRYANLSRSSALPKVGSGGPVACLTQ